MRIKWFNKFVSDLQPAESNDPVIVVVDPSKTNMAIYVSTVYGTPVSIVELSGNNWSKGPVEDTSIFCQEFKAFLTLYLRNLSIMYFGIEKAITKRGMMHHHSNMTLTEIRSQLIDWCITTLGFKPDEINNWSWKHTILPEGYRSQSVKMSKRFLVDVLGFTQLEGYYENDVTDAVCMAMYVLQTKFQDIQRCVTASETTNKWFMYALRQEPSTAKLESLEYTPGFSLQEHIAYGVNRLNSFRFVFPTDELIIDDIYGHSTFKEYPVGEKVVVEVIV